VAHWYVAVKTWKRLIKGLRVEADFLLAAAKLST